MYRTWSTAKWKRRHRGEHPRECSGGGRAASGGATGGGRACCARCARGTGCSRRHYRRQRSCRRRRRCRTREDARRARLTGLAAQAPARLQHTLPLQRPRPKEHVRRTYATLFLPSRTAWQHFAWIPTSLTTDVFISAIWHDTWCRNYLQRTRLEGKHRFMCLL